MSKPGFDASFRFAEVASSAPATALFVRKFGHPPPPEPHHIVAWMRTAEGVEALACYVHFYPLGEALLGGGACVDNRVLRLLEPVARRRLRECGGLYRLTLEFAIARFMPHYAAIFGYCGDRTAEVIDRATGFVSTPHECLLVYWLRAVDQAQQDDLIARAHAVGAF